MPLYDDFPYTNFHSLNLDWIVKKLSELENGESTEDSSSSTATLAHNLSGNYPYTNFHALNLDWLIRSMLELESGFETVENEWQSLRSTGLLNDEVKNAILECFQNVAWVNDQGQQYYNTLHDLFFPPVVVSTLTAVLDQGERVFHTGEDINVIKDYLTVTAELSDGTLITVPSTQYVLTGSLSQEGSNIIVVTYMNASTTITVNAEAVSLVSISAVYTQSGTVYDTDSLDSLKSDLVVTAAYSDSSTATVPSADYTLSGTLTEGTSTITVTYRGLTATFNVTVTSALLYSLYDHTFSNADPIATGLTLLTNDRDITFAFDVDFAGQQSGTTWKLFAIINGASPYAGLSFQSYQSGSNYAFLQLITAQVNINEDYRNYNGNLKLIITHANESDEWHYYYKKGSGTITDATISSVFQSITGQLTVGGTASGSQVFNGTVNKAEVYSRVLSADKINAFMGETS